MQPHEQQNATTLTPATTIFLGIQARQDYRIINLWEIDANLAFQEDLLSLLPFVPIMQNGETPEMLEQAAQQLRQNETLDEFSPLLGFFANFVMDSALVQQILRWDMVILEESPWYHEIIRRGEVRGIATGRQEEASDLILRMLTRRAGPIAPDLETQIRSFPREQLETLGDALLDFSGPNDLTTWLNQNT